jgi:phosphoribosylanthranilate isomerase
MPTRIKVCGITRPEDALAAVDAGVDAIGLVFYPPSPRYVNLAQAIEIVTCLPPFVTTVGLFVDMPIADIRQVIQAVGIDLVQFHGHETAAICGEIKHPWIRAIRMQDNLDLVSTCSDFTTARGILLDAYCPGVPGGTGMAFDWSRIPATLSGKIILAGGLHPNNVAQAVREVCPYAVDVSGGVESSPGIKDQAKIAQFVAQVRGVSA